uniref:Leucine rich repeat n=1 Tax=Schistocephalus solidus TaxID=70667 RepID=A0A0X3NHR9_SCHSO
MDSENFPKCEVEFEGKLYQYHLRLRDEQKCLELLSRKGGKVFYFQNIFRIEFNDNDFRLNDGQCIFRIPTDAEKKYFCMVLTEILKYWRELCPQYNYRDESVSVSSDAIYELIKNEHCDRSAEESPAEAWKNYFKDSRLKNVNFVTLEEDLQMSEANGQIQYLKLFTTSKFLSHSAPVLMLAASSRSAYTVIDLSGEKIDEELLNVLQVSFKINKSLRGLTVTNSQFEGGSLSEPLKFLSQFSLLRLLDVSNKSKTEKDKHDEHALKSLGTNAARNLVDFRISNQNLTSDAISHLISDFRISLENVPVKTLSLICLCLSGNTVNIGDLEFLLSNSPYLRQLQLDECQLDVFQVMRALETAKCQKLELLSMKGNEFGDKALSDGKTFGALESLTFLNLSCCQGKGAATTIGSIWTALKDTQTVQRHCRLIIKECGLSDGDVKSLIRYLPNPSRIRSLDIGGNHFGDETSSLLEVLLQKTKLHDLSIGTDKKSRLQLSKVAELLQRKECTLKRLKLGKVTSTDEIAPFLSKLAEKNPLESLDISECTLKEADTSSILQLLWSTEEIFMLTFNPSHLKQTLPQIENFIDRKSELSTFCVDRSCKDANRMTITIWKSDGVTARKDVRRGYINSFPESKRLIGELVNPPSDVLVAQEKLSSSIARLQLRIPAEQLSYLSIHLPDVDIAKNAIEEYRNTPSLHVELLDSALDPTAVAKAQKAVLNKLADALQAALVETVKNTMESIFSNLKPAHGKEFCSVHPRAEELIQKVQPLIDSACASIPTLLDQIVMPMVLSVNAKLVQQMYTYMLEAITTDVQNCLKKVPERSQLVCRSTVPSNPDEYAQVSNVLDPKPGPASPTIEESLLTSPKEAPLSTVFRKTSTSSSSPTNGKNFLILSSNFGDSWYANWQLSSEFFEIL